MLIIRIFLLSWVLITATASDSWQGSHVEAGVTVTVQLVRRTNAADLRATFTPEDNPAHPWHLYSRDLPRRGVDGLGRPTLLEVPDDGALSTAGDLTASAEPIDLRQPGSQLSLPVYPDGPVTLHLPVQITGEPETVRVVITYMACNDQTCLPPVQRQEVVLARNGDATTAPPSATQAPTPLPSLDDVRAGDVPAPTVGAAGLQWHAVHDRGAIKAVLAHARTRGQPALIDFTGPSCLNCQVIKKQIMPRPAVRRALAAMVLIKADTDRHRDLVAWQQAAFGTQARPFFVRVDADETVATWGSYFPPGDREAVDAFTAFLAGGSGRNIEELGGWWQALLLAVFGGLFTLIMPCTYPMIPFTINFFAKQSETGRRMLPLALAYGAGIVFFFVALGVILSTAFDLAPSVVAGSSWTNLVIGALFLFLGLSLLDAVHLRLPGSVENLASSRTGYLGALAMGLTFAIAAFACTAPIAGVVLAQVATGGEVLRGLVAIVVYAVVLAVPFVLLALSPGLLRRMPRAGAWMQEFKVIGGLVEIAAALKFLAISDAVWDWGIVRREVVLAAWTVIALTAAVYVIGWLRLRDDAPVQGISPLRLLTAMVLATMAFYLASGLGDNHLGMIEGLFPADTAPELGGVASAM